MLFSTTYLCKNGSSTQVYTKNKFIVRIIRFTNTTNIDSNKPDLVSKKQHRLSH